MIQDDIIYYHNIILCIRYLMNITMHTDEIGILNSADIEDFLF